MAEVSMADLRNLLAAAAEANKATAEVGQVNAERISKINSSLEKLTLAQQEGTRTASKMEMTLERVISANTALDRSVADLRQSMERVATRVTSVEATAAKLSTHEQPSGRRSSHRTQGVGTGEDQTSSRALVKGERSVTYDQEIFDSDIEEHDISDSEYTKDIHHHGRNNFGSRLPKSDFPKFDGENPKWWKKSAEKYFKLYNIESKLWVDFATMHFKGNAALWLQTYEALHSIDSWAALCVGVFSKFNRDKYGKIMDIFFAHRQSGSVDDYAHKFEELMHKILLYNHAYDETFFVRRFILGLKSDIRRAIKLHNPGTVDLAYSMAQTQEAMLVEDTHLASTKFSQKEAMKFKFKQHAPLPGLLGAPPEEKKSDAKPQQPPSRFDSLRAQRRAKGECFKCGGKYGPTHKCPDQVQLKVLEEILESLQIEDPTPVDTDTDTSESETDNSDTEETMKISVQAMSGTTSKRSMRLQGQIGKFTALIWELEHIHQSAVS
jgi:hypothetical protein